jgi:Tfp pilus assembly protein PilX
MFMLLLLILALVSARVARESEAIAGNSIDQKRAFQCAEASITEAHEFVRSGSYSTSATGVTSTLKVLTAGDEPFKFSYWRQVFAWGTTTARKLTMTDGTDLSRVTNPCFYVVEQLDDNATRNPAATSPSDFYRITARGAAGRATTRAFVQATFGASK